MSIENDNGSAEVGAPDPEGSHGARRLAGRRILIVEDDPIIALSLEENLSEQGLVVVGTARDLDTALRLAAEAEIEIALLDVKIGPDKIDPVADLLAERGCPFIFTSGFGTAGLPQSHLSRTVVEKPCRMEEIVDALLRELGQEPSK